ncbi:MAG TPA: hypothetical protein VHD90_16440 [Phototrophicaceae bacterium]|nr:hypothetical protein [Phototrophicaceae bacterium]
MSDWQPFEDGKTIGIKGAEGGTVIADEQHEGGARITLEENCLRAPYAITCVIYGWAYHTRFLADQATAHKAYDDMKVGLEGIVALLEQTDTEATLEADQIEQAVEDFVAKFP